MTILERVRGERRRTLDLGRVARDLPVELPQVNFGFRRRRREGPIDRARGLARTATHETTDIASSAIDAAATAVDRAATAATAVAGEAVSAAGGAVGRVGEAAGGAAGHVGGAAGDAVGRVGETLTGVGEDIGRELARAGRELKLDERFDDLVKRVRGEIPTEKLTSVVTRLERELPDTDKDRYDRAFSRGWHRARSSYAGIGLLLGTLGGLLGAFFLDPQRGADRRAALGARISGLRQQVTERAAPGVQGLTDRAKSMAADRGVGAGDSQSARDGVTDAESVGGATASRGVSATTSGDASGAPATVGSVLLGENAAGLDHDDTVGAKPTGSPAVPPVDVPTSETVAEAFSDPADAAAREAGLSAETAAVSETVTPADSLSGHAWPGNAGSQPENLDRPASGPAASETFPVGVNTGTAVDPALEPGGVITGPTDPIDGAYRRTV